MNERLFVCLGFLFSFTTLAFQIVEFEYDSTADERGTLFQLNGFDFSFPNSLLLIPDG